MQLDLSQIKQLEINSVQSSAQARDDFARTTARVAVSYQRLID